jgi:hypothetical protein
MALASSFFLLEAVTVSCCYCRLCLSISDFHPDTWNPAWSVSTILTGLLSFMVLHSSVSVVDRIIVYLFCKFNALPYCNILVDSLQNCEVDSALI